ncbi:MAG: hypothetical protein CVV64_15445 [Candidatus Wallbacteria bacterium HGW-Wallbacteria-1]|uniref:Uncharacterized protein n=1 Tax=Candidatus Wallbacteria bacterium HGW-Wallbacteria-1 TaxID=2013854 RepID=A0A2N1PLP8_9BACT|nr:MAG: hypothetical protein CVV64_15445 [Candidatus Wallbacteria bacterium HGW-Wallbacteria-1]
MRERNNLKGFKKVSLSGFFFSIICGSDFSDNLDFPFQAIEFAAILNSLMMYDSPFNINCPKYSNEF